MKKKLLVFLKTNESPGLHTTERVWDPLRAGNNQLPELNCGGAAADEREELERTDARRKVKSGNMSRIAFFSLSNMKSRENSYPPNHTTYNPYTPVPSKPHHVQPVHPSTLQTTPRTTRTPQYPPNHTTYNPYTPAPSKPHHVQPVHPSTLQTTPRTTHTPQYPPNHTTYNPYTPVQSKPHHVQPVHPSTLQTTPRTTRTPQHPPNHTTYNPYTPVPSKPHHVQPVHPSTLQTTPRTTRTPQYNPNHTTYNLYTPVPSKPHHVQPVHPSTLQTTPRTTRTPQYPPNHTTYNPYTPVPSKPHHIQPVHPSTIQTTPRTTCTPQYPPNHTTYNPYTPAPSKPHHVQPIHPSTLQTTPRTTHTPQYPPNHTTYNPYTPVQSKPHHVQPVHPSTLQTTPRTTRTPQHPPNHTTYNPYTPVQSKPHHIQPVHPSTLQTTPHTTRTPQYNPNHTTYNPYTPVPSKPHHVQPIHPSTLQTTPRTTCTPQYPPNHTTYNLYTPVPSKPHHVQPIHPSTLQTTPRRAYKLKEMNRRMSLLPRRGAALGNLGLTEEEIQEEVENDTYELVSELVKLPTRARIQTIRALPMSFHERRHIRSRVISVKLSKKNVLPTCCTDCSQRVSLFLRRFGSGLSTARQRLVIWRETLKDIGGRFGSSVLSYFQFLKWLLMFNIFSLLINFSFITIPQIVHEPNISHLVGFRGLELLTGVGYFNQTLLFYGGYNGEVIETHPSYNMQLAYFFTIAAYLVLCGVSLIYSMAKSFQKNFTLVAGPAYGGAWRLLCSWDFSVINEKAIQNHKNNLCVQLKESLSERLQRKAVVSVSSIVQQLSLQLLAWLLSVLLAVGSCAAIYFLQSHQSQVGPTVSGSDLTAEASTLLLPVVVSLINLIVPLLYSLINNMESYTNPRTNVYIIIARNVLLKMSILGILCYYWLSEVPSITYCWESFVGQSVYRLVVVDFIFCLLGSFFGEFLRNVIGTKCIRSLGVPEFDVATNVLNLIYAQTLAWIGIYFSPLLPVIQVIKLFIIFYLKRISLSMNCQPPKRTGRAAQMQTVFIALLFIPSFVGALSMVAYTVWSLTPSAQCGPFQGLGRPFQAVQQWMAIVQNIPGSQWAWWIFEHVLRSELFFYLSTLIVLVFTFFIWQVTQGRKQLIRTLREQIVNEGKDKAFLLNRLQSIQKKKRHAATFTPQDLMETTHFNQNWMNTFPLNM
ncbi:transmembrane channel-like protein 5 [Hoplias malabaricus]|uniref:transmembrane channel-like protein 5 n=1 Tax=Hoplias malabaricus TaxID=27720 RepID=UPI003461AFC4